MSATQRLLPLSGITVVEICHSVAGPYGGAILAGLGARVVKVEDPRHGDHARGWGPPYWHGMSTTFQALNRDKEGISVDLRDERQLDCLRSFIVDEADVLLQNLRPGSIDKTALAPQLLCDAKPSLIYCNLGAFGAGGPLATAPGYDPLMQAFSGLMSVTGEPGGGPVRVGPAVVDMGSGMWAAIGILAALHRRSITGQGCVVDTSLFETAIAWMTIQMAGHLATGEIRKPMGSGVAEIVPHQAFKTEDGYIMVAAGNDKLFQALCEAVGHDEWAQDSRFATNDGRVRNRDLLISGLEKSFGLSTKAAWAERLDRYGVPNAPIQTLDQVAAHPQTVALGILQRAPDKEMKLVGLPLRFDGIRPPYRNSAPSLGQHSDDVLTAHTRWRSRGLGNDRELKGRFVNISISSADNGPVVPGVSPTMDLGEDYPELRDSVRRICALYPSSYWRRLDKDSAYPTEFIAELTSAGLLAALIPEEYGGSGLPLRAAAVILQEINANGCTASQGHAQMYIMGALLRHGSAEQKQRYLPAIASGELRLQAFAVTEPTTGSDTTKTKTTATRTGNASYCLNGQKVWTSRAEHSDLMLVLARTTPLDKIKRKTDGLSLFLVDIRDSRSKGLTIRPLEAMINHNATEVFFDNLEVPAENLIGEEGKGFHYLLDGLNAERILVATESVGDGQWCVRRAVEYANSRTVFGRTIGKNQGVQFPIARSHIQLDAADLMCRRAAFMFDSGLDSGQVANTAKLVASEAAFYAADVAMQTHGGFSLAVEYDIERKWREIRLYQIAPISTNMVLAYVAQHVLGLERSY